MFKVIIAGTRTFQDYSMLEAHTDYMLSRIEDSIEIVSGGARGADELGEQYAKARNYRIKKFPADWEQYGKRAGVIRNAAMAEYADALLAYWDGQSRGTKNMIDEATARGLKVSIKIYSVRNSLDKRT